jgi:hypothetical protein
VADLADVERALVGIAAGALFPTTYVPGAYGTSVAGTICKIYRGWPTQESLVADMVAGKVHVSVFPEAGMTRNVSRWWPEADQVGTVSPTISTSVAGSVVTLAGTITAGNVVGIQSGKPAKACAYIVQASDTLTSIACRARRQDGRSNVIRPDGHATHSAGAQCRLHDAADGVDDHPSATAGLPNCHLGADAACAGHDHQPGGRWIFRAEEHRRLPDAAFFAEQLRSRPDRIPHHLCQ